MLLSEVKSKSNLLSLDACWLVCKKSLSYIHSFLPKLILLLLCGNNLRNVIFVAFVCCRLAGALLQKCGAITYLNLLATILVIFSDSCDFQQILSTTFDKVLNHKKTSETQKSCVNLFINASSFLMMMKNQRCYCFDSNKPYSKASLLNLLKVQP